jgi:hypothetical protein
VAPVSPYKTALNLGRPKPDYIKNTLDQDRVAAYWTYEDIYRNVEEAFLAVMRNDDGDEVSRRLVPSARTIIEATNRYLAKDVTVTPQPLVTNPDGSTVNADPATIAQVMKLLNDFMSREEFHAKFMSMKRWMLIRADAVFHLMADDTKLPGQRLRLTEVHPGSYFKLTDEADPERITGVYIVNIVDNDDGDPIAQRQAYLKEDNGTISSKLEFFESDGWDDRLPLGPDDLKPVAPPAWAGTLPLLNGIVLPSPITTIPVYHFRNSREGVEPFGVSEIQGIETLLAGINQTATDEDIAVALLGIGVFYTTSGRPRDDQGNEVPWYIAPAAMLELEGQNDKIGRLDGAKDITPLLDHSAYLESKARETTGTPDVAVGKVDVQVAQSGIALSIQFAPIIGKNEEKEVELKGKLDQMWYDIVNMWLPAYESVDPKGLQLLTTFGDPLPVDRAATLKEILDMVTAKLIPIQFAQKLVQEKLGYQIPAEAFNQLVAEQGQMLDATGMRLDAAAAGGPPPAAGAAPGGPPVPGDAAAL